MSLRPTRYFFADHWEYLDFKRAPDVEITKPSLCGKFSARLKKEGSTLWYTLTHSTGSEITTHFERFRASERRLREFHTGCARMERNLRRHLRTGESKWLKIDRPFGPLHGGALLPDGGEIWRGSKDDPDPDEWLDLVEDEGLARLLYRVDCAARECSHEADPKEATNRAWELLKTIPVGQEYHVEVLRRRLMFKPESQRENDLERDVRWARALVDSEPHDVLNWWYLDAAVEALHGKEAAVEVLREGIERLEPEFTLPYSLARHLCALNRLDEAQEAMRTALENDPCALETSLKSECFAPIHDFIRELAQSEWFRGELEPPNNLGSDTRTCSKPSGYSDS